MINTTNMEIIFDYAAKDEAEILKCLKVLLTTPSGTVPFDREFGIRSDIHDSPLEVSKVLFIADVTAKVRKYEPRVDVKEVTFTSNDGLLIPKVVVQRVIP